MQFFMRQISGAPTVRSHGRTSWSAAGQPQYSGQRKCTHPVQHNDSRDWKSQQILLGCNWMEQSWKMGFCHGPTQVVCHKNGKHHTYCHQQASKFCVVFVPALGTAGGIVGLMVEIKEHSFYHVEQFGMLAWRRQCFAQRNIGYARILSTQNQPHCRPETKTTMDFRGRSSSKSSQS